MHTMSVGVTPYIHFIKGEARAAMTFYQHAFGGELSIMTFGEAGQAGDNPELADQVMHSSLHFGPGRHILASDTPPEMGTYNEDGRVDIAVSSSGDEPADADFLVDAWEKLAADAEIRQPLVAAPWGDRFGMLKDQFGIVWMFNIPA